MSCILVIVPAVMASWPVILSVVTAAASACGYAAAQAQAQRQPRARSKRKAEQVEVCVEQSEVLSEAMQRDSTFTATKGDITVTVSKDVRGQLSVCASGENVPKLRLQEEAQALTNRIVQQYAYHKVMTELGSRGFQVVNESVSADQRIRLRVRRHA